VIASRPRAYGELEDLRLVDGRLSREGHVSLRHPDRPSHFLLSCSRSPELVVPDDIVEFRPDGEPADPADKRQPYLECFIRAAVYEARPDAMAVVHNHSPAVVPFSITGVPLRPLIHTAGMIGASIPVWDIADADSDEVAPADRDDGAPDSDMMSPPGPVPRWRLDCWH
jgi:HCOMODA/2-hydroxy-3-carboxy-muconic semialdehyde decarboxylase